MQPQSEFYIPCDNSFMTGRNGTFSIREITLFVTEGGDVYINGISKKTGVLLNGGFVINVETMDKIAKVWSGLRTIGEIRE